MVQHRADSAAPTSRAAAVTAAHDPVAVGADFVRHVTGLEPTPDELAVLRAAYEHVAAAERSA